VIDAGTFWSFSMGKTLAFNQIVVNANVISVHVCTRVPYRNLGRCDSGEVQINNLDHLRYDS
jgi:hypothetical protein